MLDALRIHKDGERSMRPNVRRLGQDRNLKIGIQVQLPRHSFSRPPNSQTTVPPPAPPRLLFQCPSLLPSVSGNRFPALSAAPLFFVPCCPAALIGMTAHVLERRFTAPCFLYNRNPDARHLFHFNNPGVSFPPCPSTTPTSERSKKNIASYGTSNCAASVPPRRCLSFPGPYKNC
jgi:hypothetical protein